MGIFKYSIQRLLIGSVRRQFHTSILCLSNDVFRVQDVEDFQKQIIDSKKPFLVGFHASW